LRKGARALFFFLKWVSIALVLHIFLARMNMQKVSMGKLCGLFGAGLLAAAIAGCDTTPAKTENPPMTKPATIVATAPAPVPSNLPTIRINAGGDTVKDAKGVTWAAESGFEGGSTIDRTGQITITGTDAPEIYYSEHYSMDSWSQKVPNGNYVVKLHFSEDYDGIPDATGRLFTYAVKDGDASGTTVKEEKSFGPWKASGAQYKAFVVTVPMKVTKGQITVTFTPEVENPQINGIEVIPQ
jgi:hypothetical protein